MKRKNNHIQFLSLRDEYPFFEYQSYSFQLKKQILEVSFSFNISNKYKFNPKINIPKTAFINWDRLKTADLNNLVFHIGMVELISYWKATCSPRVIIKPHKLDIDQVNWWKKLYFYGLGEFFYLNGIDPEMKSFMVIQSEGEFLSLLDIRLNEQKIIVPVGGGKDSVVTLELLKQNGLAVRPMALNPRAAIKRTIESAGFSIEDAIVFNRKIDPLLLELNDEGFLNGHTPFSALLAFVNLLSAALTGSSYIALSNESSANQSTIPGTKINHQYSKSFEFEKDFNNYVKKYINPKIEYFSFLRPLNELQIAKLFAGFNWHFNGFRSCNVGSKIDEWCGECPKCLFTDIMLSPFLSPAQRYQIFRKNVLDDSGLEPIFDELTGKADIKPFECVGTPEEINAALWRLARLIPEFNYPSLLKKFVKSNANTSDSESFHVLMKHFNSEHLVPVGLIPILKENVRNVESGFKLFLKNELAGKSKILILGFGREGRSALRLLTNYFPGLKIGIADRNTQVKLEKGYAQNFQYYTGENYLDALNFYDFVIKSPGIKLSSKHQKKEVCITSQTALFLSYFRKQTIGITGTKGKSTTASLIHYIIKQAGMETVLLGNIGTPAFDHIEKISDETIIVYELSAHQLQNIQVSPHISILLNIFPEHLDHFETLDEYRMAKLNIGMYQHESDYFISERKRITADIKSKRKYIDDSLVNKMSNAISNHKDGLKGAHNHYNAAAAVIAAELVGIERDKAIQLACSFKSLPHRLEFVGTYKGIDFYNDSISTVPESTMAAIKTLTNISTLILGGFDRGLDYTELVAFLKASQISTFIFLGIAGDKMQTIFNLNPNPLQQYIKVDKLENAFEIIKLNTRKGTSCLLSPAAASYDQFHNFEHRGDLFKTLARSV